MVNAEREPITGVRGEAPIGVPRAEGPPKSEGVLAFGCKKEVAKFPPFLYFAKSKTRRYLSLSLKN